MKTITGNTFRLAAPFWRDASNRKTGWVLAAVALQSLTARA